MSAVKLSVFRKPVAKANGWIKEIGKRMKWNDEEDALKALRVVLHALRDRLTIDEAAQLSAQLPLVVRGIFFEGWRPHGHAHRAGGLNGFFGEIDAQLPNVTPRDRKRAVQIVFDVLAHHISQGEVGDIAAVLPAEMSEFWTATVAD